MNIKTSVLVLGTSSILFSGCAGLSGIAGGVGNIGSIIGTGSEISSMFQSVEVSGARNKDFAASDFQNIKSVSLNFSAEDRWWKKNGKGFSNNIETQLMKLGLDTYKKDNGNAQVLVTGTVTGSDKHTSSFNSSEWKSAVTEVSFSFVNKNGDKTMASVNLAYKKGVSNVEAAKDTAKALKALVEYPDMDISDAFEKIK